MPIQGSYAPRKANLLKLLQLLTGPHPVSLQEISQHLPKVKDRTIFAYLKAIEEEYPLERRRKPFPAYTSPNLKIKLQRLMKVMSDNYNG